MLHTRGWILRHGCPTALTELRPSRLLMNPSTPPRSTSRRSIVSAIVEPPLDCPVLEKPCTLVLLEDPFLYQQNSWNDAFQARIPLRHGMSYASLSVDISSSSQKNGLDEIIDELKLDLPPIPDTVLITRGPFVSWSAAFYLESFPLQGLVMVDPFPFSDHSREQHQQHQQQQQQQQQHQREHDRVRSFLEELIISTTSPAHFQQSPQLNHVLLEDPKLAALCESAREKTLKLEPNAVPLLILQSCRDPTCDSAIAEVAKRHSDPNGGGGSFGEVPIVTIDQMDADDVMATIDDWVETIL